MSFTLGVILMLSTSAILYNIPASQGSPVQGYTVKTLSQVLTPQENFAYAMYGTLPPRVVYSPGDRAYRVKGQSGQFSNDLKQKRGDRQQEYKVMPRWQYFLRNLVPDVGNPMEMMKNGMGYVSMLSGLLGRGNGGDGTDGGEDGVGGDGQDETPAKDSKGGGYGFPSFSFPSLWNSNGGDKPDDGGGGGGGGGGGADEGAVGGDGQDETPAKESKGGGYGFPSFSFPSLWNSNGGDKPDGGGGDGGGANAGGTDYKKAVQDVLQSDLTKSLAKTGIGMLPGGPTALTAMEVGSIIADDINQNKGKDEIVDDLVQEAISSELGQAAVKSLIGMLPGGDKIVKTMDAGSKVEDATKKIPGL